MAGEPVLIAAYAARALTEAARRAGFSPLVADVFGDDDTRAAAANYRTIEGAVRKGIRAKPLIAALDALAAATAQPPIGLVLGSGFEDKPRLMHALDGRYRLIGSPPAVVTELKDPIRLAALLKRLAIPHPETQRQAPRDVSGWLSKLQGGTGGAHIRAATPSDRIRRRRYFQRHVPGDNYSLLMLAPAKGKTAWLSRQWTSPSARSPFRYGGAVTVDDAQCATDMRNYASAVAAECDLRGLVSFDFRFTGETTYLIEINPRPAATLDIFDRGDAALFAAHVAAARQTRPAVLPAPPPDTAASAILYAGDHALTMPALSWPDWASDRTPAGTNIAANAPIATVRACAATADMAMQLLRTRLATLEDLLYESAIT